MEGKIITFGTKAATIQTASKQQFYAPAIELNARVVALLYTQGTPVTVTFIIDKTQFSGHSNEQPRYYAQQVKLIN
tara:strand:- start:389 stop:616 length:228 start_codon:yes stop_codon:yes gene_type:complete